MRIRWRWQVPDNAVYYHLAYIVAIVIYLGYSLRLAMKRNALKSRPGRTHTP